MAVALIQTLWNQVDRFVPSELLHGPPHQVRDARTYTAIGLLVPALGFFPLPLGLVFEPARALASASCHALFLIVPWVLRRTGSLEKAAHAMCSLGLVIPAIWCAIGGGVDGPSISLLVIAPMVAAISIGGRAGRWWLAGSILVTIGLLGGTLAGIFPNFLEPVELQTVRAAMTVLSTLLAFGAGAAARRSALEAIDALAGTNAQLDKARVEAEAAHARAEAAAEAKGQFLATISHELRTPMNGVLGFAELLLEDETHPERRASLETIVRSGRAMVAMVNDVLDFSKLEAGQMGLEDIEFELADACASAVELVAQRAHAKKVELGFSISPSADLVVRGDPTRLGQVLVNLLGNAVKFTERGHVRLEVLVNDASTVLSVCDTGIGISEEAISRLFEAYSQAEAETTRKFGGTGLGLNISMQIVRAMGGDIRVTSEAGRGSEFRVLLPTRPGRTRPERSRPRLDGVRVSLARVEGVLRGNLALMLPGLGVGLDDRNPDVALFTGTPEPSGTPQVQIQRLGWPGETRSVDLPAVRVPLRFTELARALETALGRQSAELSPGTEEPRPGPQRRVLLVDDNPVNRRVGQSMLDRLGHEVVLAEDGLEALAHLQAQSFDLVLMDCRMPRMDGLEATRRWRTQERGGRTPIFALTGEASAVEASKCLEAGMDGHLGKPVALDELRTLMAGLSSR